MHEEVSPGLLLHGLLHLSGAFHPLFSNPFFPPMCWARALTEWEGKFDRVSWPTDTVHLFLIRFILPCTEYVLVMVLMNYSAAEDRLPCCGNRFPCVAEGPGSFCYLILLDDIWWLEWKLINWLIVLKLYKCITQIDFCFSHGKKIWSSAWSPTKSGGIPGLPNAENPGWIRWTVRETRCRSRQK